MIRTAILLMTLLFQLVLHAQDAQSRRAQKKYQMFSFQRAAHHYEKTAINDLQIKRELATSYWKVNQYEKAESVYTIIIDNPEADSQDLWNYAMLLRINQKYKLSEEYILRFIAQEPEDPRSILYVSEPITYDDLNKDYGRFKIHNLGINTEGQEFGTCFYNEKIIFSSSRTSIGPVFRRWNSNGLPFLDLYACDINGMDLENVSPFNSRTNKKFHEGPLAISPKSDYALVTRNNYDKKDADRGVRLELCYVQIDGGEFQEMIPLKFNSNEYSCGQPSVSSDGKWVYFASDMPGGFGGVDLYKVAYIGDGTFGIPINLGGAINTPGDELFPFIHADNDMLFFSSNGRMGLGGLDVFVAQLTNDVEIGEIKNVGIPLNSNKDDFAFILDQEQKVAYFSSNRDGGNGDDDIYSSEILKPFTFVKTLKGVVTNDEGDLLVDTKIKLVDNKSNLIGLLITDSNGNYEFEVPSHTALVLSGENENYLYKAVELSSETRDEEIICNIVLDKTPFIELATLANDKETGAPLSDVLVTVTEHDLDSTWSFITDALDPYKFLVRNKALNDTGRYTFKVEKEGYLTKTKDINLQFDHEGTYNVHEFLNLNLTKVETNVDLAVEFDLNPIYFDFNKYNIRSDAALELDKIVQIMNDNPEIVIELGSHTDSRGRSKDNQVLSENRAKSSVAYIQSRITNPERIYGKGYGESRLINTCSNGVECSDEDHQLNRRTEFLIKKKKK